MHTQAELSSTRVLKVSEADLDEVARKEKILALSPFAGLPSASREALFEIATVEKLSRRQRLTQQGETPRNLVLIGSGRVRLDRTSGDRVFPVGHRGPGETVGETALGGSSTALESAVVLDETEALVVPLAALRKLLTTDEGLRAALVATLAERHFATEQRLESLLLHGVEARLVDFLLAALARWGEQHPGGTLVTAPFTHADIALLVGSTRETVTLLLGKLKRAGVIDFEKRRIIVPDQETLRQHSVS
jgi:CRP/FNR family transcriptional regulator, cyclic AMP receptor protein